MKALASWLRGWARGGGGAAPRGVRRYVIDAAAVFGSRGDRVPMHPREIISALQRLGRFVERERVKIQAVVLGEALRKAPDGAELGDLEVFYAATPAERVETIARLVQKARRPSAVTVITSDAVAEQRAQSLGCEVMRASTFRRGLELALSSAGPEEHEGGGSGSASGGERRDRGERGDRERRRRRGRGGRGGENQGRAPRGTESGAGESDGTGPASSPAGGSAPGEAGAVTVEPSQSSTSAASQSASAPPAPAPNPVSDEVRKLIDLVE